MPGNDTRRAREASPREGLRSADRRRRPRPGLDERRSSERPSRSYASKVAPAAACAAHAAGSCNVASRCAMIRSTSSGRSATVAGASAFSTKRRATTGLERRRSAIRPTCDIWRLDARSARRASASTSRSTRSGMRQCELLRDHPARLVPTTCLVQPRLVEHLDRIGGHLDHGVGPGGASLPPIPRLSNSSTSNRSASEVDDGLPAPTRVAEPWISSTGAPTPWRSHAIRTEALTSPCGGSRRVRRAAQPPGKACEAPGDEEDNRDEQRP